MVTNSQRESNKRIREKMLKICEMVRAVIGKKADTRFHMMVEKAVTEEQLRTQDAERKYHSHVILYFYLLY